MCHQKEENGIGIGVDGGGLETAELECVQKAELVPEEGVLK
jgi:hypothetical protein